MDKQTFNLLMLTYKTSLKHIKSSIKNGVLTFDPINNSPDMTNLNGLIKEATDIENKIAFLNKHMSYFTNNGDCCDDSNTYVKPCNETGCTLDDRPCNETGCTLDDRPCNEKNNIIKVKQENEVIEVNKNDILKETMRVEIINELRGKCVDMFDNVVKK